ncbi:MAG: cyclomaltodextrinase C-terminal domain-containing protein, partial [Chitinophagaceae bacterium]
NDVELMQMAITYLLTTRGIPQILYGTEVLMNNTGNLKNDGIIRSDFPGGWPTDTVSAFTNKGLTSKQLQTKNYLSTLLNWRKVNNVIANGNFLHFAPFDGLYVYFRYNKQKTVMVILNINNSEKSLDTARFAEILSAKKTFTDIFSKKTYPLQKAVLVPAKTALVFEVQ